MLLTHRKKVKAVVAREHRVLGLSCHVGVEAEAVVEKNA